MPQIITRRDAAPEAGPRPASAELASPAQDEAGIAAGTIILTLEGALPVEFLEPGDRIITREGMRVLRAVRLRRYSGPAIRIRAGALGHDRPEQDLTLPEATPVLIRDWRAPALFQRAEAVVPLAHIADGEFITRTEVLSMRLHSLIFDTPQIVYAEGLELACGALASAAAAA